MIMVMKEPEPIANCRGCRDPIFRGEPLVSDGQGNDFHTWCKGED